jgi:hypothetical protein
MRFDLLFLHQNLCLTYCQGIASDRSGILLSLDCFKHDLGLLMGLRVHLVGSDCLGWPRMWMSVGGDPL